MVVSMERARPGPLAGDVFMGAERFWQILGRNLSRLGDCRTRWTSRLYAAMNSVDCNLANHLGLTACRSNSTFLWSGIEHLAAPDELLENLILLPFFYQRCDFCLCVGAIWSLLLLNLVNVMRKLIGEFLERSFDEQSICWARHGVGNQEIC